MLQPAAKKNSPVTGVGQPPGGLGSSAWWGVTAGLVAILGLLFWSAAESMTAAFEHSLPAFGRAQAAPESSPGDDVGDNVENDTGDNELGRAQASPRSFATPQTPTFTLVDVESAVRTVSADLVTLIDEGKAELPEFKALTSNDSTRAARARAGFSAWGRIWRNRLKIAGATLPPPAACAVHAAMDPACRELRSILEQLKSVAEADQLELATERLESAAVEFDLFLHPPAPEPTEETSEDPADVGDSGDR